MCTVAGWGKTHRIHQVSGEVAFMASPVLKATDVPIRNLEKCKRTFQLLGLSVIADPKVTDQNICAGDLGHGVHKVCNFRKLPRCF